MKQKYTSILFALETEFTVPISKYLQAKFIFCNRRLGGGFKQPKNNKNDNLFLILIISLLVYFKSVIKHNSNVITET